MRTRVKNSNSVLRAARATKKTLTTKLVAIRLVRGLKLRQFAQFILLSSLVLTGASGATFLSTTLLETTVLGAGVAAPPESSPDAAADLLIARESFDYPAGASRGGQAGAPLSGLLGGSGWDGGWFTSPLNKDDSRVMAAGMSFRGVGVTGGKLTTAGREIRTFRKLDLSRPALATLVDQGRLGRDGTTIWIAFLTALSDLPGNSAEGYGSIHLNDGVGDLTVDQYGDKRAHQRVQIGDRNSAALFYIGRVTNGAPGGASVDTAIPFDTTPRLVVARFDFQPGDEAFALFVDPAPDREPAASSAAASGRMGDFRFDTVQVGSGGSRFPDERVDLDELRIGSSFLSVIR
jgi:hypothetical protein